METKHALIIGICIIIGFAIDPLTRDNPNPPDDEWIYFRNKDGLKFPVKIAEIKDDLHNLRNIYGMYMYSAWTVADLKSAKTLDKLYTK